MCGIVGFTGNNEAAPILLDGLSKLEYRGYDSAGIAVRNGEHRQYHWYPKVWTVLPDRGTFRTYAACRHRISRQSYPD